jgi:hypothetical protein
MWENFGESKIEKLSYYIYYDLLFDRNKNNLQYIYSTYVHISR